MAILIFLSGLNRDNRLFQILFLKLVAFFFELRNEFFQQVMSILKIKAFNDI